MEVQPPHLMEEETADLIRMIRTRIAEDQAPIKILAHQEAVHSLQALLAPLKLPSLKRMDQTKVSRP